jgi:hypothetical protein
VPHNLAAKKLKISQRRTTTVGLLDEPHGWRHLHAMAQQERDPQRLAFIIDQMNALLDRQEKMAANENPSTGVSTAPDNSLKVDLHTWQFDA